MTASQFHLESRKIPFLRLLFALSIGIILQWYSDVSPLVALVLFFASLVACLCFRFLPSARQFSLQWLQGVFIMAMILAAGALLCFIRNPLHKKDNCTTVYREGDAVIATVNEALLDKAKTCKANIVVNGIYHNKTCLPASGTVIVYFDKAGLDKAITYGTQIVFNKPLQKITNANNPGGFDYQRFLLFQGVTAQVYLKNGEYKVLESNKGISVKSWILSLQKYILNTIRIFIPNKKEQGVAEALLIGYRNDLDKQLVQSYSNTGVVHIIAISGLHLGMIYGFILLIFSPFRSRRWYRFGMPLTAIFILWIFTLLAGAVPSILRSAVTFTFIAGGVLINRKSSIYNSLAASAFCLLLYNPFYLWDVGFQLSYMAVLGITMFTKPVHNLFYLTNKPLDKIWLATCVTLAAQVFTLPIILYNFHQFPILFLITNLLVVALSEIILFALLFLVVIGFVTPVAALVGKLTGAALWLMNSIIEYTEKIPYSVLSNIKTDVLQAWMEYLIIILLILWLLYRLPKLFVYSLVIISLFFIYISVDVWQKSHQQKLVVYSVQKHNAIEVVTAGEAICFYDDSLRKDITATSFTIKPAHTLYRVTECRYPVLPEKKNFFLRVNNKTVFILRQPFPKAAIREKIKADIAIISGNPKLYINDVCALIDCKTIIADNNTSAYKLIKWKQTCDSLHIYFYAVAKQGAFVADL